LPVCAVHSGAVICFDPVSAVRCVSATLCA